MINMPQQQVAESLILDYTMIGYTRKQAIEISIDKVTFLLEEGNLGVIDGVHWEDALKHLKSIQLTQ